MTKLRKSFRLEPWACEIIKARAKETKTSEADVIEGWAKGLAPDVPKWTSTVPVSKGTEIRLLDGSTLIAKTSSVRREANTYEFNGAVVGKITDRSNAQPFTTARQAHAVKD